MPNIYEGHLTNAQNDRYGIVVSRFNAFINEHLLNGALDGLRRHGVEDDRIDVVWVPGAFEIPVVAKRMAENNSYDAVICLGCVIRGETTHYDYVCLESARGLNELAMRDKLAIGYGIITVENEDQAIKRADPKQKDKGGFAANACLEMIKIRKKLTN